MVKMARNGARSLGGGLSVWRSGGGDQRLVAGSLTASTEKVARWCKTDGGRANKRESKAEEGGLGIIKGSRNLVEAPDG
jgi:hypothetical protein